MKLDDEKIIKALFLSCLVVALTSIKAKLEHRFENLDAFLYFVFFLISLFTLAIIEVVFERLDESRWFRKIFGKRNYIYGWWLNYATDTETGEIYNFGLLKIDSTSDLIHLDGTTFKAFNSIDNQVSIRADGHFLSTVAQYQGEHSLLAFDFTIDLSDKVSACKHRIMGHAQYFFERSDKVPATFTGEFSTETPSVFCSIIGHRLDEELMANNDALIERYRRVLDIAIKRKWIDAGQLPRPTVAANELMPSALPQPRRDDAAIEDQDESRFATSEHNE